MTLTVDVSIQDSRWQDLSLDLDAFCHEAAHVVFNHLKRTTATELSFLFTNDAFIQKLNLQYRHQDKPTNVLSFPTHDPHIIGDIVLAYETIMREAHEQGKLFEHHLLHLIVHGLLHLLGYDHLHDSDAQRMEALEITILDHFEVPDPYADSSSSS